MPATYEPIATTTLSSAATSITFSSIPNTYTDLRIVLVVTGSSAASNVRVRYNSDTGSNYSSTWIRGNGTAAASSRRTGGSSLYFTETTATSTTIPSFFTLDIFSYASSTYKTSLSTSSQDYNGSGTTETAVGLWSSTSAIDTILISTLTAATFSIGTTATLYGIKAA